MTNAEPYVTLPFSVKRRASRVRAEDHPRLRELTGFDRGNPWIRVRWPSRGYARVHPSQPAMMEFVPDDGESRTIPVSRNARDGAERSIPTRGFGSRRRHERVPKGSVAVPPVTPGEPAEWWAVVQPDGTVQHRLVPSRWVREQTALRDRDEERRQKALEKKRARLRSGD